MENLAATIHLVTLEQGGGTFDQEGNAPKTGCMVGLAGQGTTIPVESFSPANIEEFIGNFKAKYAGQADMHLGTWVENGIVYLDVAKRFPESRKEQAVRLAKATGEKAIFILSNFETLYV
jgi:hypothetical protein